MRRLAAPQRNATHRRIRWCQRTLNLNDWWRPDTRYWTLSIGDGNELRREFSVRSKQSRRFITSCRNKISSRTAPQRRQSKLNRIWAVAQINRLSPPPPAAYKLRIPTSNVRSKAPSKAHYRLSPRARPVEQVRRAAEILQRRLTGRRIALLPTRIIPPHGENYGRLLLPAFLVRTEKKHRYFTIFSCHTCRPV